jgi:ParB family transcriptional regulator, chromosome partitioning protein
MEFFDTSIVEQIEMKMIRSSQFAVRDRFQRMSDEDNCLIASIREHGLLQPILIRPLSHGFEIVAGHRRFHACRSLRWRFIPCKIRELADKEAYEIQLTENMQRKSMDPIEEAEAFRRYVVDFGWGGVTELAAKIGKSEEYVSHRIQLLKLPEEVKQHIIENRINVSSALELTSISSEKQNMIMQQVASNDLTVRQIREMKSLMKTSSVMSTGADGSVENSAQRLSNKSTHVLKLTKKTTLALRITLARIDNLIDEVHSSVEPAQRGEIVNFLMGIRLRIHSLIDETIRYKNANARKLDPGGRSE